MPSSGKNNWACLFLVVSALVYLPALKSDFVNWDDGQNVYENPLLHPPTTDHLLKFWRGPYADLYIPMTYTSYAIEARLWGDWAPGYHATNFFLHVLAAFGVYRILMMLAPNPISSMAGALFFLLHPVQAEAVCWISARKDVLAGVFSLFAIERFLSWESARRLRDYALATALFALALLSKPSSVIVPLMAFAVCRSTAKDSVRPALVALLPWGVMAATFAFLAVRVQPMFEVFHFPLWQRTIVASDAVFFYASKILCPLSLVPVYDHSVMDVLRNWWAYGTLVPVGLGVWILFRLGRECRLACELFLIGLLPVMGFFPFHHQEFSTVADRYLYLAMPAVSLLVAALLNQISPLPPKRERGSGEGGDLRPPSLQSSPPGCEWIRPAGVILVLVVLGSMSWKQSQIWRDPVVLWQKTLVHSPNSMIAHNNFGKVLLQRGDPEKALAQFQTADRLAPSYPKVHNNLGAALTALRRYDEAAAEFRKAIELQPNYADARANLERIEKIPRESRKDR